MRGFSNKGFWSVLIGTVLGVVLLALIIAWAGLGDIWKDRRALELRYIALFFATGILTCFLRAWRFCKLIGSYGILSKLLGVVSVHTFMLNVMPFSSGELAYPVLLKRYGVSSRFMQGVPSIVIARIQDGLIYSVFLVIALFWAGIFELSVKKLLQYLARPEVAFISVIALGGLAIIGWIVFQTPKFKPAVDKVRQLWVQMKNTPASVMGETFLLALVTRFVTIIGVECLFRSVGAELSFSTIFLITSLYVFLPYLPINTPAGIGIAEGFLLYFMLQAGFEKSAAAAASIQMHLIQLSTAALLAGIGILVLELIRRGERARYAAEARLS